MGLTSTDCIVIPLQANPELKFRPLVLYMSFLCVERIKKVDKIEREEYRRCFCVLFFLVRVHQDLGEVIHMARGTASTVSTLI